MAREKFKFWLDTGKDDEFLIAKQIDELKRGRLFTSTIRDGIRLICDLKEGRLDVLFELFPWVSAEFLEYMQSLQPQKTAGEIELQKRIERMEHLLLEQGNVPVASTTADLKSLAIPKLDASKSENADDDLLLVKKSQLGGNSAKNFLDAAFSLEPVMNYKTKAMR